MSRIILSLNFWALFLILSYTGLRISEAAALQWEDIDVKRRTIDINKQLYGTSVRKYKFTPPKNEQSERIVSYGDTVARALEVLSKSKKLNGYQLRCLTQGIILYFGMENFRGTQLL